jgi:hypothetical protein
MQFWIVGQADESLVGKWDLQGVFETEGEAVKACQTYLYFVAPIESGVVYPNERTEWPGLRWPLAEVA